MVVKDGIAFSDVVSYSLNGYHIAAGADDYSIRTWDAETGAAAGEPLRGHTGSVQCVAYSPDGQHIISGSDDEAIRIWDTEAGAAVGKPPEGCVVHRLLARWISHHLWTCGSHHSNLGY